MYCLDTDFLVAWLRRNEEAHAFMERLQLDYAECCTTPITLTELFRGFHLHGTEAEREVLEELVDSLGILVFDAPASETAGRLLAELERAGQSIGDFDAMIAALALRHNRTLVTRNAKHFKRVPNLQVMEW